jgi:hypothetical protein
VTLFVLESIDEGAEARLFSAFGVEFVRTRLAWLNVPMMAAVGVAVAFLVAPSMVRPAPWQPGSPMGVDHRREPRALPRARPQQPVGECARRVHPALGDGGDYAIHRDCGVIRSCACPSCAGWAGRQSGAWRQRCLAQRRPPRQPSAPLLRSGQSAVRCDDAVPDSVSGRSDHSSPTARPQSLARLRGESARSTCPEPLTVAE